MEACKLVNYKTALFTLFVFLTTWNIISCGNPSTKKVLLLDEYPSITITNSMGDLMIENYMALIGNIGYLVDNNSDSMEVMVISQRVEEGTQINYHPIGVLTLSSPSGNKKIIVATTPNQVYSSIEVEDLTDLSVQFGNIKRMVEQWYTGKDGFGNNRIVKWEDARKVLE
jgi:inorganic pyrophosphatase